MKKMIAFLVFVISTQVIAGNVQYNYRSIMGKDDAQLKAALNKLVRTGHQKLDYKVARRHLFGELHLEHGKRGPMVVDVYCKKEFTRADGVGDMSIPNSNVINCEHTWPQSKFTTKHPRTTQKGDLHHLYPTDNRANSSRSNHNFADVDGVAPTANCDLSEVGGVAGGRKDKGTFFEPPSDHKGNVARSLFYFSVRYEIAITALEEEFLRKWHDDDPVDMEERRRNDSISEIQGNRNPFIDRPNLVDQINNF